MLHTYCRMQLHVMCNCTNLQLHVLHATEFQLHATVAKPKISSSDCVIGNSSNKFIKIIGRCQKAQWTYNVATLLWESVRMKFILSKWGLGSPLGLPKVQSSIARVKTPRIEAFCISLKIYWSVDVQNGLTWPIWTSATQVMAKRKAGSQTDNLTPDHGKSGIDSIPLRSGGVRHAVGKLLTRATTLVQTSSRSEVCTRSYSLAKLWDSQPWWFQDSHLGVPGQKAIWMPLLWSGAEYTIWGKVMASPSSGRGESCESKVTHDLS
jgi:hypothetical protein